MKHIFSLMILLSTIHLLVGQTIVLDSASKTPIPSVNIFDTKYNLIGVTDMDGKIHLSIEDNAVKSMDSIVISHIGYKIKTIVFPKDVTKTISLEPIYHVIEEVAIGKSNAKYLILKGYFRNTQFFSHEPKDLADGIVMYYIPLDKPKEKVTFHILEYRKFANSKVAEDFKEVMGPFSDPPRIPSISNKDLISRLGKDYYITQIAEHVEIKKESKKVGHIQFTQDEATAYIDYIKPNASKHKKIFRLEAEIDQQVQIENYRSSKNIDAIKIDNLRTLYSNVLGRIKRKKKFGYHNYETISEFYVIGKSYMSEVEYNSIKKNLSNSRYLDEKSFIKSNYWEKLEKLNIPNIDAKILNKMTLQ